MSSNETSSRKDIDHILSNIQPNFGNILSKALSGHDITAEEGVTLLDSSGIELNALILASDQLRAETVGDTVTYVVNRNINFTNVCIKQCGFCAFSRDFRHETEGYLLPIGEITTRAKEAHALGATEVCIQAGLPPKMKGDMYQNICKAVKKAVPEIHIHGFSPEEILYGATRSKCEIKEYLQELRSAGVDTLPGTSAEILDQDVRDLISPGRITKSQWENVITTAHNIGIKTTSTIMYGHVETNTHKAKHIALIRDIQKATGGFTEFVPLGFIHSEAPMYRHNLTNGLRQGPTGIEVLKMHAVSRIMLNNWIPNLQVSWVKEGHRLSQILLGAGANDLGGTLINESISTSAGAGYGQLVKPSEFRTLIRDAGRQPAERSTLYKILRVFDNPETDPVDPLDKIEEDAEKQLGSYFQLIKSKDNRYEHPKRPTTAKAEGTKSAR